MHAPSIVARLPQAKIQVRLVWLRSGYSPEGCRYAPELLVCAQVHDWASMDWCECHDLSRQVSCHTVHNVSREYRALSDTGRT